MYQLHHFFRLETGTGREDWLVLSALAAALTTVFTLWISSGGGEQVTQSLRGVISNAVDDIGREQDSGPGSPAITKEIP